MDNVVFYGQGNEATRRQVRSAAAAHSHKTGDRKPKTSKRSTQESSFAPIKKKCAATLVGHQKTLSATSSVSDAVVVVAADPATSTFDEHSAVAGATVAPVARDVNTQGEEASSARESRATNIPRPEHMQSQAGMQVNVPVEAVQGMEWTPSRRLPQYSWTEYPRYGFGGNTSQSLATASAAGYAASQTSPMQRPTLPPLTPGYRPYTPLVVCQKQLDLRDTPSASSTPSTPPLDPYTTYRQRTVEAHRNLTCSPPTSPALDRVLYADIRRYRPGV